MLKTPTKLALTSLKRAKARSTLTVFGVTIGIALVVVVFSAGHGIKSLILGEISSFGDNWINIEIKVPSAGKNSSQNASDIAGGVSITSLTTDDMAAISALSEIEEAYAGVTTQVVLNTGNEKKQTMVFGVTDLYDDITDITLQQGRFFSEQENDAVQSVIVLGSDIAETLFGNQNPIGERVKVNQNSYRVIGVVEPQGATGFFNMDELAYIPLKTTQKKIMGIDHVLFIVAQMNDTSKANILSEEIRALLRERHDISDPDKEDFAVTTQEEAMNLVGTIVTAITGLLIALASISLLVGGVGIMNVMYVSVTERTFEIGLRKSFGATSRDILLQFLMEAIILTFLGGLIGIAIGALLSYTIAFGANQANIAWDFAIPPFSIVLAVGFSTVVGIFFGLYPAKQAASLDPIVALRQTE